MRRQHWVRLLKGFGCDKTARMKDLNQSRSSSHNNGANDFSKSPGCSCDLNPVTLTKRSWIERTLMKHALSCDYSPPPPQKKRKKKQQQNIKPKLHILLTKDDPVTYVWHAIKWDVLALSLRPNETIINITHRFLSHNELLNLLHLWDMVFIGLQFSLTNSLIDSNQRFPWYVLSIIHTWSTGRSWFAIQFTVKQFIFIL